MPFMSKQSIDEHFQAFAGKVSKLHQYQRHADSILSAQHHKIIEDHVMLPEWALAKDHGRYHYFHFTSPLSGLEHTCSSDLMKLDDQIELNAIQKLKIYQWLLVEAYEEFRVLVEHLYSECIQNGYAKGDEWKQVGSSRSSKTLRKLAVIRAVAPTFQAAEVGSLAGSNYRVSFVLVDKLRHIIVHHGGYCSDLGQFQRGVGIELSGLKSAAVDEYAISYFALHRDRYIVDLLEMPLRSELGIQLGASADTMLGLFRLLVEYGYLVTESIKRDFLNQSLLWSS